MTLSFFGWSTILTFSKLFSYKVVGTTSCYALRCLLEGSIFDELKSLVKYILDFCYLGLVLIVFNLAQKSPNSAINDFLEHLCTQSTTITIQSASIFFMLMVFIVWIVAITNCKKVNKIKGITNSDLFKKGILFGISGFLSASLFGLGIIFQ